MTGYLQTNVRKDTGNKNIAKTVISEIFVQYDFTKLIVQIMIKYEKGDFYGGQFW